MHTAFPWCRAYVLHYPLGQGVYYILMVAKKYILSLNGVSNDVNFTYILDRIGIPLVDKMKTASPWIFINKNTSFITVCDIHVRHCAGLAQVDKVRDVYEAPI